MARAGLLQFHLSCGGTGIVSWLGRSVADVNLHLLVARTSFFFGRKTFVLQLTSYRFVWCPLSFSQSLNSRAEWHRKEEN